jgi:hypothetical protein
MIKWMISSLIMLSILVSCAGDSAGTADVKKETATATSTNDLSAGQQAAIDFCNCTHVKDSLAREDCYGTWVEGISTDSSIIDSEAKVMGRLMFDCNPQETVRVLLLLEE